MCEFTNTSICALEVLIVCHNPNDSHVSDFVLDLETETADMATGTESKYRKTNRKAREEEPCGKGSVIKTLCVFENLGIWDLKLVDWINIFSLPQASVLYLTF